MTISFMVMMMVTLIAILACGLSLGIISQKYGKFNLLNFIPILIAIEMFNIVYALVEMSRAGRL
ncbi:hypothetical protein ACNQFZ_20720 [Schinkia sp. CFF1]